MITTRDLTWFGRPKTWTVCRHRTPWRFKTGGMKTGVDVEPSWCSKSSKSFKVDMHDEASKWSDDQCGTLLKGHGLHTFVLAIHHNPRVAWGRKRLRDGGVPKHQVSALQQLVEGSFHQVGHLYCDKLRQGCALQGQAASNKYTIGSKLFVSKRRKSLRKIIIYNINIYQRVYETL